MRTRIGFVLSALVALVSMLSIVQPAAAAPAAPYYVEDCLEYPNTPWTVCFQERGVVKLNESASSSTTSVAHGQRCYQDYYNGELVSDYCGRNHQVILLQDGDFHVYHTRAHDERTFEHLGVTYTCTSSYHLIFANGAARHEEFQSGCTPPL
jgi:hypothetical protein